MGFSDSSKDRAHRIARLRAAYEAAPPRPGASAIASRSRLLLAQIIAMLESAQQDTRLYRPGR